MKPGLKMKFRRMELGITQTQLRETTGANANTIVALERGEIDGVRVKTLKNIAKALNSSVSELFFSDEDSKTK